MIRMKIRMDFARIAKDKAFSTMKSYEYVVKTLQSFGFVYDLSDDGVYVYDGPRDIAYILTHLNTAFERWPGLIDYMESWYGEYDGIYADFLASYRRAQIPVKPLPDMVGA